MQTPVLLPLLITMLVSCGSRDQPLQILESTTWISDRAATLRWIAVHRPNLVGNHRLESLFGTMTIHYSDTSVVTANHGTTDVHQHRVIGQTNREIAMITYDIMQKRDVIVTVEIDSDRRGYWIYNSQFDIKEHFVPFIPVIPDRTGGAASEAPPAPSPDAM